MKKTIQNPIIKGFYSDPSVCKANGKYYLVCSSMHYFPSIPLFESADLINWRQIGNVLTGKSQIDLSGVPSSGGIFAPTIRYHEGRFYVVTTDDTRGKNFYVYTDDIQKEWSEPIYVNQGGIDPSLCFEDKHVYFTSNGRDAKDKPCIYQCEINISNGEKLTKSRIIWYGSGGRLPEGPHLYKIGDYYYLIAAEGGTEYGHMETCARARSPYGPFENYPNNPFLTNRDRGEDEIQGIGHGDLIEDYHGNWWIIHHGFRQMAVYRQFHHLGREVFIMPVFWSADDWCYVDGGYTKKEVILPQGYAENSVGQEACAADDSDIKVHGIASHLFLFLREPNDGRVHFYEDSLSVKGCDISLDEPLSPSFCALRQTEFDAYLCVGVESTCEEAGVSIYMDEAHHYDVCLKNTEGGMCRMMQIRSCIGGMSVIREQATVHQTVTIQIWSDRESYRLLITDKSGACLEQMLPTKYLSSEVAGGFTGVVWGMYCRDEKGREAYFTHSH